MSIYTKKVQQRKYAEVSNGTPTPYRFVHAQDGLYRKPDGGMIHMKDLARWAKDNGFGIPRIVEDVR